MSEQQIHTVLRFAVIFLCICFGFVAVICQIVKVQTYEKSELQPIEQSQVKTDIVVRPARGNILDTNGNLLATSVPLYDVFMDTRVEALHLGGDTLFYKYVDSIAEGLSRILRDTTPQAYKARMVKAFKNPNRKKRDVKICGRRVNYIEKKEIEQLPLVNRGYYKSGFHYEDRHLRTKPYGSLGSRTIGNIYPESGIGYSGLELSFEEQLHGIEGKSRKQKVAGIKDEITVKEAVSGYDVVTTFDAELMDICESELRNRLNRLEAEWGCCVLMETSTGEIKAISNLDRTDKGKYVEKENHAVKRVEPGSVFKTISLLAVLDDGKMDLYDTISVEPQWEYYKKKHIDSHPKDTVYTLRSALAVSSNIAFAKMVTRSYEHKAEKFVNKLRHLGVCDSLKIEIPGAEAPRIDIPKDKVTLSNMSYGYSVELSPVQIVTIYNAIANNGKMVSPLMVKRVEKDGEVMKTYSAKTLHSHICGYSTIKDVRLALSDVVWDNNLGTASVRKDGKGRVIAKKAQSDLVRIAGKTGTAQVFEKGKYNRYKHRITFVGYFPEENPEYTCICMINAPGNYPAYDAGYDCGQVVRSIAEKTMAYTGVYVYEDGEKHWKKTR